ncbi:MAG TPA: hypothetical protein VD927_03045 [Chryseosolibacter sp.]|nr:hypothetical protein [Chryseosolibacter sp.]
MKYRLTGLKSKNNTQVLIENAIPAQTGHLRGYGMGVTLTAKGSDWQQNPTFESTRLLQFCEPTVIPQ